MTKKKSKKKSGFKSTLVLFALLMVVAVLGFCEVETGIKQIDNSAFYTYFQELRYSFFNSEPLQVSTSENLELPAPITGHRIVKHTGYTLSWNKEMLAADWVAYELTAEELDNQVVSREGESFKDDPLIPGCPEDKDYKGVGNLSPHKAARGHLAPAADFKWSEDAMNDTFYLSNVCVQYQFYNAGIWLNLENAVRDSARITGKVYVVTGPILSDGPYEKFKDKLVIPKQFYKALLIVDKNRVETIAFVIPQDANRRNPLSMYAMSVDELENLTGIDFFPSLEDEIEDKVEASYNIGYWSESFR